MYNFSSDSQTEMILTKYPVFRDFMENCHGSGIEYEWSAVEDNKNVYLFNSFHCMDDCGMYCAVVSFTVRIPKNDILGFKIECQGNRYWYNKNMFGEYLTDTVYFALSDSIKKLNSGMPFKDGFREILKYELTPVKVE